MKYKRLYSNTLLAVLSVIIAFAIGEVALRIIAPAQLQYYVWPPHLRHTFHPDTSILQGVSPVSRFSINSFGVRVGGGNINRETNILQEPGNGLQNASYRYCICIGGSTTECLYLDDDKSWEANVAGLARERGDSSVRFIGSIGKSGCTSTENYMHLKYCVSQYKKINTVICMVGINDMLKRLSRDSLYQSDFRITPAVEDSLMSPVFGKRGKSWLRKSALLHLVQNIYHSIDIHNQDDTAQVYTTWRINRQHAIALVDSLPDLQPALANFERNLNLIIDEAQKQKLEIIFVNQAALWKDSMSADEQAKLWMGGIGNFQVEPGHKYYTTRALRQALTLYNQRMAKVCMERKIKLVDIDAQLPRTTSVFYDDCHFNEAGAKLVGKFVYDALSVHRQNTLQ